MGKNSSRISYETWVQLLLLSAAILTPFLAFNFMDLELFSVSKTLWFSIKPWLCPPYVYLLINFIIFFIAASSSICSNATVLDHDHRPPTDSFIESPLVLPDDHDDKYHMLDYTFKDLHVDEGSLIKEVVDKRELRKSKTFNEGESRPSGRRERYVRILSQEELDRRVEAFIYRCKRNMNDE